MLFLFLKLECCGSSNYTDWQASEWKKSNPTKEVPLSCCKEGKDTSTCNAEAGFNLDNINTKVIIWYSYSHAVTRAHTRSRTIPATHSLPRISNTCTRTRARARSRSHAPIHLGKVCELVCDSVNWIYL